MKNLVIRKDASRFENGAPVQSYNLQYQCFLSKLKPIYMYEAKNRNVLQENFYFPKCQFVLKMYQSKLHYLQLVKKFTPNV